MCAIDHLGWERSGAEASRPFVLLKFKRSISEHKKSRLPGGNLLSNVGVNDLGGPYAADYLWPWGASCP